MQIIDAIARILWMLIGCIIIGLAVAFVVLLFLDSHKQRKAEREASQVSLQRQQEAHLRREINEILARMEGDEGAWV